MFSILADGTIEAKLIKKGMKLGADELQDLLRFAISKHKLMQFDRKAVEAQARGGGAYIMDAADTVVTIAIKGKKHSAAYNASTWASNQYPAVQELQDLEAVRKRLQSLLCIHQLGDKATAKKLLDLANAELKKTHPKLAPFTLEDLHGVSRHKDGQYVRFIRWTPGGSTGAHITRPPKGKPTVKLYVQRK